MKSIKINPDLDYHPNNGKCLISGKNISNEYIVLSGGALLDIHKKSKNVPLNSVLGYSSIWYHYVEIGKDGYVTNFADTHFYIVEPVKGGQYSLVFAGVDELRTFFNQICDHVDSEMKKAKKKNEISEPIELPNKHS